MSLGYQRLVGLLASAGGASGVAVTITAQLDDLRIIDSTTTTGGGQGKGQGSVVIPLSFTGTQPVYARRRSASDGVTIVQAAWLANASATTGNVTLSGIDAPAFNAAGAPVAANDGWSYIDVATAASGPWTNGTSRIGVGWLALVAGQSLAVRLIGSQDGQTGVVTNASLGVSISPYTSVLCTYNETRAYLPTVATMPWATPADSSNYDSTFVSEFLRRQVQLRGVMCGMIGHARGAQQLSVFIPPGFVTGSTGAEGTQLAAVVARSRPLEAQGSFSASFWYQGHTEAGQACPPGGYATGLTTLHSFFTSINAKGASFAKYVGSIPNIDNALWGTPFCRTWIRAGVDQWASANSATHLQCNDVPQVDGVHQNQAGAVVFAQAFHRATRAEFSLRANAGPALLSATRSGTTITATFSDVGQGNLVLTGTPGNRIYVFPTGQVDKQGTSNNRFPVSAVSVTNKTTLSITLANDPGDGNVLDMWLFWPNELSTTTAQTDMIRDDLTDGDGIAVGRPAVPKYAAVTIAAPVPASTINPAPTVVAATSQATLTTLNSPVWGAQEQTGFGQTFAGGNGLSAASKITKSSPVTISCFFTYLAAPAALQVLHGGFAGNFLGISTTGKLSWNSGGATTLIAGHRYHVYAVATITGHKAYLTDITAAGSPVQDVSDASPVPNGWYPVPSTGEIRSTGGGSILLAATATVEEVAVFDTVLVTSTAYVPPSAPFTGTEANIRYLYHCDGNGTEVICA